MVAGSIKSMGHLKSLHNNVKLYQTKAAPREKACVSVHPVIVFT